ncbi:hypothetical protein C4K14_4066 [Pseudomonas chlororaphis subsp. aureofaciens]|uniref:hypothetical protein n=1 Tax=Pseudomonas chlororaphis TaxID=587753 RepID=UPI000F57DD64|nr:hypothetical protein [Pseudomonas chlororaphis]AZD86888.1 hypothetical protein C4K14_4066 [Pseudomonas chlororaphis subsp. aureofaciens]
MSNNWYNAGFACGRFTRALLTSLTNPEEHAAANPFASTPGAGSVLSKRAKTPEAIQQELAIKRMRSVPAIVRRNGISLNQWFYTHTAAVLPEESPQLELFLS